MTLYRASIRHALSSNRIEEFADGLLAVGEDGKILDCGPYDSIVTKFSNHKIEDFRGNWILPGFVDCHVHLPQLDCRNKGGLTLFDWLKTYIFPTEASFSDPKKIREIAPRFYDELLSHGVTTAAIYSTVHAEATDAAFEWAHEKGLRAIIGQVLMDQNAPHELIRSSSQLLRETEQLIVKWHEKDSRLFYAVTPRFALTCSKKLLEGAGRLAEESKVYWQTHLAETKREVAEAESMHGFRNYVSFYESNHSLTPRSIFAHCIYLKGEEWRQLSESHCAVAHCPTSNVFLQSGTMPWEQVEKNHLKVGLGSDVGAGPTFSMSEIINCACEVHPQGQMNYRKGFYLATLGGAEALSLENQIGNFLPGKWADFSLFDSVEFHGRAKKVFVAGKSVLYDGVL